MEKYAIRPTPIASDPRRHELLLRGEMRDVTLIIKKFGAMCGRPAAAKDPEGYNFSLVLHDLSDDKRARVDAFLGELSGGAGTATATHAAMPAGNETTASSAGPVDAPPPALPTMPELPTLKPASSTPPPLAPPPTPEPLAPVPVPVPVPEPAAPPPVPVPAPEPVAPPPAPVPAPQPAAAPVQLIRRPLWGFSRGLDPKLNFETLLVGAYNRFAHAAATSVVSAPGSMYNPLFLHGPPGVGKTHLAHAIGKGLAGALSEPAIVVTSGARMGQAVTAAIEEGRYAEIEKFLAQAKVLVVDDVHLISINEKNTAPLAKLFDKFFAAGLQVILTSIYPARALGALEEALKISLAKGWAVDLKIPNPTVQLEILQAGLDRRGINMTTDESRSFHERLGQSYPEAGRWVMRYGAFVKQRDENGLPSKSDDIFPILFDPGVAATELPSAAELEATKGFAPPMAGADAMPLVMFLPKGQEAMVGWVASQFFAAAAQHGLRRGYRVVKIETYDAEQPFGVPFAIGEAAQKCGAQGALVVGPPNESGLAARVQEFSHAVSHILEGYGVACGWLAHRGTTAPSNHLRAHLDLASSVGE